MVNLCTKYGTAMFNHLKDADGNRYTESIIAANEEVFGSMGQLSKVTEILRPRTTNYNKNLINIQVKKLDIYERHLPIRPRIMCPSFHKFIYISMTGNYYLNYAQQTVLID